MMKNIAIFASGSGSNAENLIRFFRTDQSATVSLVLTNNPDAFVIKRAQTLDIEAIVFDRDRFYNTGEVLSLLKVREIDFIVLAGFLWLVPAPLIDVYKFRIVNIHPALLPKYGGKGMYGRRVHEAVIGNGDKESGITVHYVNPAYDEGDIIFQVTCRISPGDAPEQLAEKIHELEYKHFPEVVRGLINDL